MKTTMTGWFAALVILLSGGPLAAHHSLANHDTAQAVRVKGTIVEFHAINPHSFIYVEEKTADGQIRRWAVEGPSAVQLARMDRRNVAHAARWKGGELGRLRLPSLLPARLPRRALEVGAVFRI